MTPVTTPKTRRPLQVFDVVRTPKGGLAVITEQDNRAEKWREYSIDYFECSPVFEHNAWWTADQLTYIGSILQVLTNAMAHPMGSNREAGTHLFGRLSEVDYDGNEI